jgi:hypothetical protein
MADYLRLPAVSASLVRAMTDRCPRAAWAASWLNPAPLPDDATAASDAGSIAHAIVLEGSEACCQAIDPADYPAEKTGAIPDGWTNKAIRAARDAARAAGKIPVLVRDMATIRAMALSARSFIDGLRTTEPAVWAAFEPAGGESELTITWDDAGVPCRIRPDRISVDRTVIIDAKFTKTSAHPDVWARSQLAGMGYATSAAFYRRGVRAAFGVECDYVFLVVEQEPPYLCSLVGLDPAWKAYGDAVVRQGLAAWRKCLARDEWPSYPSRAAYPEMPGWMAAQIEEREVASTGTPGSWQALYGEIPQ